MSRTALITGVAGQDGSYLTELLLDKGYRVFGVAGPAPGEGFVGWAASLPDGFTVIEADMLDGDSLSAAVHDAAPDEVYNFAGFSSVGTAWEHAELAAEINAIGVLRLLQAIERHAPHARFCQASSADMFGHPTTSPQCETTPIAPVSPYGSSKAYAHFTTQVFRASHDLFACSAILYNHESPRRSTAFVTGKIADAVARIKLGLSDSLALGNVSARRDWGFAGDYVEAMWRMLQRDVADDYVVATGVSYSVHDLCDIAFSHVGLSCDSYVSVDAGLLRPTDTPELVGDATKAREVLGWKPSLGVPEIMEMMVDARLAELSAKL